MINKRIYINGKHKFFDDLLSILMGTTGLSVATHNIPYYLWEENGTIEYSGKVSNINMAFAPKLLTNQIKSNVYPQQIELEERICSPVPTTDMLHEINVAATISGILFQGPFIRYYDSIEDAVVFKYGPKNQCQNWPTTLNFGRVIRNAFAHGNKISFDNSQKAKIIWKKLAVDHSNNNEMVLYNHIAPADIIVLMEEMDALL
jgi:hypothetical protein